MQSKVSPSAALPAADFAATGVAVASSAPDSPAQGGYRFPAPELQALVDTPVAPAFVLSPKRGIALLISQPGLPSIADVSQPELKLAGFRLNPSMRAGNRFSFGNALSLMDVQSGKIHEISGLPAQARIADTGWSPDERWVACSLWTDRGVELWLLDVQKTTIRRLLDQPLNATAGRGFTWLGGSQRLLVRLVPLEQAPAPKTVNLPSGPNVQETEGGALSQTRTYPDMLKTPADADQLDWQLQSQLAVVQLDSHMETIGAPGTFLNVQPSPDGAFILVSSMHRPYSTLVPLGRFPLRVEIWNAQGKMLKTMTDRPLLDRLPSGNDAVESGPRNFSWRDDAPATLYWAQAKDGGDPAVSADVRDSVWQQAAPFEQPPRHIIDLAWRYAGIDWAREDLAIIQEYWWKTRDLRTWRIQPDVADAEPDLLYARKSEDRYADPGNPAMTINALGRSVLLTSADGLSLFMLGAGASPEGDCPFIDRYDLSNKQSTRLWRSQAPYFEQPLAILDDRARQVVTCRETTDERPNFYLRDLERSDEPRALTQFPHPTPQLRGVQKQQLHYRRADGIALSAMLYLPADYDARRDGPLPLLMWAYPQDFKTASAANQVTDSPYRFNRISYWGPQAMLARGYAILDNPAMPIIGEGDQEPNDTYVAQLTMDAQAAIDEVVRLGVADRDHIAIGGHSYGAFMTVNLLAHTRLFRVGIARSGAYNRTLTPFGFQSEDRNFWKAKTVYQTMSPFNYAENIKDPLLLIHGEIDNNSGTFPVQSERLYQALQGLGATARLVMLPNESHAYRARESIMQMLWEQDRWLEKYLKNAKPREAQNNPE